MKYKISKISKEIGNIKKRVDLDSRKRLVVSGDGIRRIFL